MWKDVAFEETWWITLAGVSENVLLLTAYHDAANPDRKTLFAYHVLRQEVLWFRNNFALSAVSGGKVKGTDTRMGFHEIVLDLESGGEEKAAPFIAPQQNFELVHPFQYQEGSDSFATVHAFLVKRFNISPVFTIEYREYGSFIIISAFEGREDLANYLIVLNSAGEVMVRETLGTGLKGIALDTFFVLSGYLIFVKNKTELVIWKFV